MLGVEVFSPPPPFFFQRMVDFIDRYAQERQLLGLRHHFSRGLLRDALISRLRQIAEEASTPLLKPHLQSPLTSPSFCLIQYVHFLWEGIWSHVAMLRDYFWLCTQDLLLVVLRGPYGVPRIKAKQAPYLLY